MAKKKNLDFEKDLEKLEAIVEQLEAGEFNLDESLKKFEEGVGLYKSCRTELLKAEKKISVLTEQLNEKELE